MATRMRWAFVVGSLSFVAAYVLIFPSGCADVEGVPSWERCSSLVGLPAFSLQDWGVDHAFDIVIPLAVGLTGAALARWLLGRTGHPRDGDA